MRFSKFIQKNNAYLYQEKCQLKNENIFRLIAQKENSSKAEHLREIVYLLCIGKITKEIAAILNLSTRTIEKYRLELNEHIDVGNVAGIIRYGIVQGILEDEILKIKFERYESKYNLVS